MRYSTTDVKERGRAQEQPIPPLARHSHLRTPFFSSPPPPPIVVANCTYRAGISGVINIIGTRLKGRNK